jgi:hypothetical protein
MAQRSRGNHPPQPIQPSHARASHGNTAPVIIGPLIARFLEEDDTDYLVGDPWGNRTTRVPKRRAFMDPSTPRPRRRTASERLVRWSVYALVGAVFGGIVGTALGAVVVLAALIRLARLSRRIHRWQRRQKASGDWKALPAEASWERMQLLAALGQSAMAMLVGSAVLYAVLLLR